MNVRALPLCLLSLLWACSSSSANDSAATSNGGSSPGDQVAAGSGASAGASSVPTVSYWQDTRPLLEERCVSCHSADGIAPFALDNYATARQYAAALAADTAARVMPPWPPGELSPAMLHDRSLTADQIQLLADWAAGGALEGDADSRAPVSSPEIAVLPSVDVSGDIGVDYTPPADVKDEYRCFLIELGTTEDRVSVGYRVTPGNPKIVHHVITSLFDGASTDALRALDDETPDRAGWPCAGGPVPFASEAMLKPVGALGSWVPGVNVVLYPEGTGTRVPSGSVAVMQVHYNIDDDEVAADRTKIDVAFAPKGEEPAQNLSTLRIRNNKIRIPAGQKDVAVETTMSASELATGRFYADGRATLRMVAGHMHMVGVQTSLTLERANGEKSVLLDIPAWNFHWQGSYTLATPIPLNADDKVTLRCVYDNTQEHLTAVNYPEPMHLVTLGEGSTDEMCIGYLTVTD
jgi:Copper type II ascorbate-dependent monooxygenase, C-terminal domain